MSVQISDHGCIAWVDRIWLDDVTDEVEEARQLRKTDAFRIRAVAYGETVQEGEGFIRCDLTNSPFTEFSAEWLNDGSIGAQRIFFRMDNVVINPDLCGFG